MPLSIKATHKIMLYLLTHINPDDRSDYLAAHSVAFDEAELKIKIEDNKEKVIRSYEGNALQIAVAALDKHLINIILDNLKSGVDREKLIQSALVKPNGDAIILDVFAKREELFDGLSRMIDQCVDQGDAAQALEIKENESIIRFIGKSWINDGVEPEEIRNGDKDNKEENLTETTIDLQTLKLGADKKFNGVVQLPFTVTRTKKPYLKWFGIRSGLTFTAGVFGAASTLVVLALAKPALAITLLGAVGIAATVSTVLPIALMTFGMILGVAACGAAIYGAIRLGQYLKAKTWNAHATSAKYALQGFKIAVITSTLLTIAATISAAIGFSFAPSVVASVLTFVGLTSLAVLPVIPLVLIGTGAVFAASLTCTLALSIGMEITRHLSVKFEDKASWDQIESDRNARKMEAQQHRIDLCAQIDALPELKKGHVYQYTQSITDALENGTPALLVVRSGEITQKDNTKVPVQVLSAQNPEESRAHYEHILESLAKQVPPGKHLKIDESVFTAYDQGIFKQPKVIYDRDKLDDQTVTVSLQGDFSKRICTDYDEVLFSLYTP